MTFIYPQMAHLLNDFIQVVNEGNQKWSILLEVLKTLNSKF